MMWVFLVLTLGITTLVFMNVLIGIISESVGKVYDARERSQYYTLCGILTENEMMLIWRQCRRKPAAPQFLYFSEYVADEAEED